MKKVLVPLAEEDRPDRELSGVSFVRTTYLDKLFQYKLLPVLVSPYMPPEMADALYAECSGVLLMGGRDVDPALYKAGRHSLTELSAKSRDALECLVIRRAVADKKPVLAICRGHQVLNVALGGTLHQHVPDLNLGEKHSEPEMSYAELGRGFTHPVNVAAGSRAAKILNSSKIDANSAHHQAIDKVAPDLAATGVSPKGIVEILEHKDPAYFCFGLQAHPETQTQSFFEPLFAEFARSVEKF